MVFGRSLCDTEVVSHEKNPKNDCWYCHNTSITIQGGFCENTAVFVTGVVLSVVGLFVVLFNYYFNKHDDRDQ